jgi:hypothetical protein
VFWSADRLPVASEENESQRFAPGLFVIGSDAGDLLFAIDLRSGATADRYVETDSIAIGSDILWRGRSLLELLSHVGLERAR